MKSAEFYSVAHHTVYKTDGGGGNINLLCLVLGLRLKRAVGPNKVFSLVTSLLVKLYRWH